MKQSLYTDTQEETIRSWQKLEFGMFIHFGLFSLAGGCWNGLPIKKGYCEQIISHGDVPQADYEALIKEFRIPKFNAEHIASLAKNAGMKYIVLTAKHHDGFCLFDTKTTDYNSLKSAALRDITSELAAACKKAGLSFGVYFSLIDWHCPWALPISSHNSDLIPPKHHEYNLAQLTELLSKYGTICELWLDMGHPTAQQSSEMYSLAHKLQPHIMINGRIWNDEGDFATMPDNKLPDLPPNEYELNVPWQTPASIYKETWGYKSWQERGNINEKTQELTESLRRVTAEGGNYLLNIGPDNEGAVIPFEEQVLNGIGENLKKQPLGRKNNTKTAENIRWHIIQPEKDGAYKLNKGIKLYRYTGEEYYSLRPIITGIRWIIDRRQGQDTNEYILRWESAHPLADDIKLCFEDKDERLYFSLRKGKTGALISTAYRLPQMLSDDTLDLQGASAKEDSFFVLELSTIGPPLKKPEMPFTDIILILEPK